MLALPKALAQAVLASAGAECVIVLDNVGAAPGAVPTPSSEGSQPCGSSADPSSITSRTSASTTSTSAAPPSREGPPSCAHACTTATETAAGEVEPSVVPGELDDAAAPVETTTRDGGSSTRGTTVGRKAACGASGVYAVCGAYGGWGWPYGEAASRLCWLSDPRRLPQSRPHRPVWRSASEYFSVRTTVVQ